MEERTFYDRLMHIDRRWVYLLVAIAVAIPVFVRFHLPISVTNEVRRVYEFVERLKPGDTIFLAIDYDPQTMAECHPMALAIMRQCFRRDIKMILTALSQNGPGMAEEAISRIVAEHNELVRADKLPPPAHEVENGVDYAYLGYKPYPAIVIMGLGQDFRIHFPQDYYGTPVDSLPLLKNKKNFDDTECVISIASGNIADFWIQYGNGRYDVALALGVTGVMAADYYQYLDSGQLFGLIGGLKGAAEYERLVDQPGSAIDGMRPQVVSHIVIIIFIILGNVGYFFSQREKAKRLSRH